MYDEPETETETDEAVDQTDGEAQPEPDDDEPKIMCYISKEMVPLSATVEVEYEQGKSFRVMPRYVKFDTDSAA